MTFGPQPLGSWNTGPSSGASHDFLQAGTRYRVIKEFTDYDQHIHPLGEEWTFLGSAFVPYDDGMSFFISFDDCQEWQVRLQWRPEEQGGVLDSLAEYITAA